jgi:RES domain-containing protein
MTRPDSALQVISLLPFLHPADHALRLALTAGATGASNPFDVVDDSEEFSRVLRGSFLTDAGSKLKDVFLVLQRDTYRMEKTSFGTVTNIDIEASWHYAYARAESVVGDRSLELAHHPTGSKAKTVFAPLLYCREKQLFMPLLCPTCARELELCCDDELLHQKELHPYSSSMHRYLYCSSCFSAGQSEFFVRERKDSDPLFLSDCMDLVHRLSMPTDIGVATGAFPCASCTERDTCFGPANSVRSRLLPFSFYPFHMLIVDAPTLNVLDFSSLISGSTCVELSEKIDRRAFPGRASSLNAFEDSGQAKWTNFVKGDERGFPELLFLKLSLLEEVVGRTAADPNLQLQGGRVWVYLPRISKNLPMGWNFRLLFLDDLTPILPENILKLNPSMALARTGLLFFQILLDSKDIAGSSIVEAVTQYLSNKNDNSGETGTALLKSLCVPANIFLDSGDFVMNQNDEECWDKACMAGFELLDAARGQSSMNSSDIHRALQKLLDETRASLFSASLAGKEPAAAVQDAEQATLNIRRVVSDLIALSRAEIRKKPSAPPDDHEDEVMETVILRAVAPREPLVEPETSSDEAATVIIPSAVPVQEKQYVFIPVAAHAQEKPIKPAADMVEDTLMETVVLAPHSSMQQTRETPSQPLTVEDELMETVLLPAQNSMQQGKESPRPLTPLSVVQPPPVEPNPDDDLSETVMIIPPAGSRPRPGGAR